MDSAPSLPTAANAAANALPRQRLTNALRALPFDCLLPSRWHSDLGPHYRQAHSRSRGPLATLPARRTRPLRTNAEYPEVVRVESSSRVALVSASLAAGLMGRSRPGENRDSDRRIMVEV